MERWRDSAHPVERAIKALQHPFLAQHFQQMVKARSDGPAGADQPGWMHQRSHPDSQTCSDRFEGVVQSVRIELRNLRERVPQLLEAWLVLRRKIFFGRFRRIVN